MAGSARIRITRIIAPAELAEQIEPKMQKLINAIHRRAERLVPKRTWNLHDTLTNGVERDGGVVIGTVGVGGKTSAAPEGARYWEAVEYGTSKAGAQRYMRPALLQSKSGDLNSSAEPNGPRGGR